MIRDFLRLNGFLLTLMLLFSGCSFDYGESTSDTSGQPDVVMNDVEYVRVRDGFPQVRFKADVAERYEDAQSMKLEQFTFEQFESRGEKVNAIGSAGTASIDLNSGNIQMDEGVRIDVESEDLSIATKSLSWQDKERVLAGGETEVVDISRSDGTSFTGWGFSANARQRTWAFSQGVEGSYFDKDEDQGGGEAASGEDVETAGLEAETAGGDAETADTEIADTETAGVEAEAAVAAAETAGEGD
jgi:LPS export ABC transporter protein LptC